MPIQFPCPGCGGRLKVSEEMAGRKVRCSKCQGVAQVPAAEEPQPAPAPARKPWASPEGVLDRPPEQLPPRARRDRDEEHEPPKRRRSEEKPEQGQEKPNEFVLHMSLLCLGV